MKEPEPKSARDDRHDRVQRRDQGPSAKKPNAQEASQLPETRGERAQRDAATTAPCSPGQPAGGE